MPGRETTPGHTPAGFSFGKLSLVAKLYWLILSSVLIPLVGVAALVGNRIQAGSIARNPNANLNR